MYRIFRYLFLFLAIHLSTYAEVFDSTLEDKILKNIEQVTFSEMGFEKAGEAYFSPDSTKIIFQAVPKGQKHYQIFVMDLQDRIPKMVSTGLGACTCPFFKPDGQKIIFASSHSDPNHSKENAVPGYQREGGQYVWDFTPYMNIYESNLDGSDLIPLTSGPAYHAECAYSSDGKKIVFASNESGSMNLYTMNSDDSEITQITFTNTSYNGGPFFSPDNTKIIFRADREKRHYLQIYVINTDGTEEKQITNNQAVNWAPFWHPNGKMIVFTTSLHGHRHYEIYAMNIETNVQTRITHNPTFDGLPVFNDTGDKMMWTSKRGEDGTSQIFIADFIMPQEL